MAEMDKLWIQILCMRQQTHVNRIYLPHDIQEHLDRPMIEGIFGLCKLFELPDEVQHIALEYFERTMEDFLGEKLSNNDKDGMKSARSPNFLQHMIACIQIASKMYSTAATSVKSKDISRLIPAISKVRALKNECRLLGLLKFELNSCSAIVFMEGLIKYIGNLISELQREEFLNTAQHVLNIATLRRWKLMKSLFYFVTGSKPKTRQDYTHVQDVIRDHMFLAASVICASTLIIWGPFDQVVDIIAEITMLKTEPVKLVAQLIVIDAIEKA